MNVEFAFLGGAVLGLLITDPAAVTIRPTKDVDVLMGTRTRVAHTELEEALRRCGFQHDMTEDAPICRWRLDEIVVDILAVDSKVWGWESKWFAEVLKFAQVVKVGQDAQLRVVTAPFLVATKLEAFKNRGESDWYGSQDLEDIVMLVDGRPEIVAEVEASPTELRRYLSTEIAALLANPGFRNALPGHLLPDTASQRRLPIVLERFRRISCGHTG